MASDPVCGMSVDSNKAAGKYDYNGQIYYFCSQHCLGKFRETPDKFLGQSAAGQATRDHARPHASAAAVRVSNPQPNTFVCPRGARIQSRHLSKVRHGAGA